MSGVEILSLMGALPSVADLLAKRKARMRHKEVTSLITDCKDELQDSVAEITQVVHAVARDQATNGARSRFPDDKSYRMYLMYEVVSSIDVVLSGVKTKRHSSEESYYVVAIQRFCPDKVAKLIEFYRCLSVYPGISIRAVLKGHREKDKLMHVASSWGKLLGRKIQLSDMSDVKIVGDELFDHSRRMVHLIGDSGSGKTTIFNALTGADERVTQSSTGTFGCTAGVRHDGGNDYNIIDTPGVRDSNGLDSLNSQAIAGFVSKCPYVALVLIVIDASARNPSNWAPFKEYYKEQFPSRVQKQIVFTTEAGTEADMEGFLEEHQFGLQSVFSSEEVESAMIISRSRARAGQVPEHVLTAMLSKASDTNTMTKTAQNFYDRFERLYTDQRATRDATILALKQKTVAILEDIREDMGSKGLYASPLEDEEHVAIIGAGRQAP